MWGTEDSMYLDDGGAASLPTTTTATAPRRWLGGTATPTTATALPPLQDPTKPFDAFYNRRVEPTLATPTLPSDSGQSPIMAPAQPAESSQPSFAPSAPSYSAPSTAPATTSTAGAGAGTAGAPTIQSMFSDALKKLLGGPSPQDAGMNVMKSPAVTGFNQSAKLQEARDRQFLAERAQADGYSGSGGFETGVLALRGRTNEAMNRFAGEQAGISEQGRRQELMQSLALALQFGDNEAARALQEKLGMGSLDVQRFGISSGRDTALDQLGYNYANLQNNSNADLIRLLFGG